MKIVGIIAEYNPFHQGHAFHLKEARRQTNADYVVVAMSGNYVQRGAPAMFDKYTRAQAALRNGADLVLELPLSVSTASAEYFAFGAVSLLEKTHIITDLCFGSECADLPLLKRLADILTEEPNEYQSILRQYLKAGDPYPKAREKAFHQYDSTIPEVLLSKPNNLLGLEYLKAIKRLNSSITPHTIPRIGSSYHGQQLESESYASASAIRHALIQSNGQFTPKILAQLPSAQVYNAFYSKPPITENAFSLLLLEKLRRIQGEPLDFYFDVTEELSNRIWNCVDEFASFSQFTDLIKTRNITRTAVSRALLHILLDIKKYTPAHYLQIIGFRLDASILLKMLSEYESLPLITNLSKATLPKESLYPDRLYESVRSLLHGSPYQNEYQRKMLVI